MGCHCNPSSGGCGLARPPRPHLTSSRALCPLGGSIAAPQAMGSSRHHLLLPWVSGRISRELRGFLVQLEGAARPPAGRGLVAQAGFSSGRVTAGGGQRGRLGCVSGPSAHTHHLRPVPPPPPSAPVSCPSQPAAQPPAPGGGHTQDAHRMTQEIHVGLPVSTDRRANPHSELNF